MLRFEASWDDGGVGDTRIAELMVKFNIPCVFYWPVEWQKYNGRKRRDYLTNSEADAIAKLFEIGSHGVNHELLTKVSDDVATREIVESKRLLEERFRKPVTKFCYPRGYYNKEIKDKVNRAGYEMARTVEVGYLTPTFADPYETHTTVHVGYNRKEYHGEWLPYAVNMLIKATELAKDIDLTYHLWGHAYEIDKADAWGGLTDLLECIHDTRR